MKTWIIVLIFSLAAMTGCASSDTAAKRDQQKDTAEENAKKALEMMKMEEEKAAKEEMTAREELDKKKAESEKQKQELGAVKQRLKQMSMAAVFVPITRDGGVFSYPGGRTSVIKVKVADDITLRPLNLIMDGQLEKSNSDRDYYNTGTGGFETCLNDQLFILYMSKDKNGMVVRDWYETLDKCK